MTYFFFGFVPGINLGAGLGDFMGAPAPGIILGAPAPGDIGIEGAPPIGGIFGAIFPGAGALAATFLKAI
jgi:hypothetical protein